MGIWFVTDLEDYSFDFWDGLLNDGGDKNAGFGENKSHACVVGGCGQLPFWVFAAGIIWRGTNLSVWGFSSDLDQNRAVLWSKSEHETPETPETLETPETPETLETPVLFRFGPKTGVFLVQKRNETPETKHLKHLKHFLWMFGLLFCKHFKELGSKVNDGVH